MVATERRRRLIRHGVLLFFLGLLEGVFVQFMANPRLGVSAHLGGVMTGTFLLVIGAVWLDFRLAEPMAAVTYWLVLVGTYGSSASLLLGAIFGTSSGTPIAGAGHHAAPWQETLVATGLEATAAAILACCVLLLWGLRGRAER